MKKPFREWMHLIFDNEKPARVLFRVDAGCVPGLSFGHVTRCLVLADTLRRMYDTRSIFLMADHPDGVRHARQAGQDVRTMPVNMAWTDQQHIIEALVQDEHCSWLVVDLPYDDLDTSWFVQVRRQGTRIVFIDDSRFIAPCADVVLNSSILAEKRTGTCTDGPSRFLLGPRYFIFDEGALPVTPVRMDGVSNVLITFGGSDPTGLTINAVAALMPEHWQDVLFWVALGPGYAHPAEVDQLVQSGKNQFRVVRNPARLLPLLLGCDLAVCAGGRTMYELYYLGKQFIPVASAAHEAEAIQEFMAQGLVSRGMTRWDPAVFKHLVKEALAQ